MIIRRMRASFGCLDGQELKLEPGLNIIESANESGKSTWCAFLRCMLYGVSSSARERGGVKPDKLRYAPWNGKPMEGELELEQGGVSLTLRRSTADSRAPMRRFSAVYTATGETVSSLTGADAGEQLTGATAEVFQRSAFISQSSMGVEGSAELERRILSILSSGEEDASFTEAEARLRAWQRRRRYHNRGHLPELEGEIASIRAQLAAIEAANRELMELESMGEECRLRRDLLRSRLEREQREDRDRALRELEEARQKVKTATGKAALQRQEAMRLRSVLEASPFYPEKPEVAAKKAERDAAEAERLQKNGAATDLRWLWRALLLAGCALVLALLIPALKPVRLPSAIAAFLLLSAAAAVWLRERKRRREGERRARRAQEILQRYHAAAPGEILAAVKRYTALTERLQGVESALAAQERQEESAGAREQTLAARFLDLVGAGAGERSTLEETERELRGLRETCAMAKGRLDTLGDKLVLESRLETLEEHRALEERQYRALEMALEGLEEANAELQSRFSPTLARRTAHYFARLTGGRYTELSLSHDLTALVRRQEDTIPHENAFLSRGAGDQFYLALRLALCELVLDGEERCPLILDDALLSFDEERLALAMELLQELSAERQIILFTCQDRETAWLKKQK